jgi:hypothetical protein
METVSLSRRYEADSDAVRAALADVEGLLRASEFDRVTVDGDRITVENGVGIATIELSLSVVEREDAALAYRQTAGIFETMETRYVVSPVEGGTEVTAVTEFAVDVSLVGGLLDATVVGRQRRRELADQLDWVGRQVGD